MIQEINAEIYYCISSGTIIDEFKKKIKISAWTSFKDTSLYLFLVYLIFVFD